MMRDYDVEEIYNDKKGTFIYFDDRLYGPKKLNGFIKLSVDDDVMRIYEAEVDCKEIEKNKSLKGKTCVEKMIHYNYNDADTIIAGPMKVVKDDLSNIIFGTKTKIKVNNELKSKKAYLKQFKC